MQAKHIIQIDDLSRNDIEEIFSLAEHYLQKNKDKVKFPFQIYFLPYHSNGEKGVLSHSTLDLDLTSVTPHEIHLSSNYPNPFNPITTLLYDLPNDEFVSISIYDMQGNVINNLVNDNQNSGYKSVQWDATNNQGQQVSAGVYLYSIEAGDFRQTKKMILLK